MKNLKNVITVVILVTGLLLVSCGDNVDPNLADVKLKIKATSSLGDLDPGARILENHITFNKVLLGVTEIEFEAMMMTRMMTRMTTIQVMILKMTPQMILILI